MNRTKLSFGGKVMTLKDSEKKINDEIKKNEQIKEPQR